MLTWRTGTTAFFVSLSVSVLLFFLYVQSLHGHLVSSCYSNHAGFAKTVVNCGELSDAIPAHVAVAVCRGESFHSPYDTSIMMSRMTGHSLPLNSRAPPGV